MRIGLISGWPWDIVRGSGTARFLLDLERALVEQGARVVRVDADLDPADYASFVRRRLDWNRGLREDPRLLGLDAVLALDCDGMDLPAPPEGPVKIACPQAVFADLAKTEPEPFRSLLLAQAEAERKNVQSAGAIVTPSLFAARGVARAYDVPLSRIEVIPHGFDSEEWSLLLSGVRDANAVEARRLPGEGPVVLAVAKLYPRKGIDLLLRSAALLLPALPALCVRVVGGGVEFERLRTLAAELGIAGSVRFEGDVGDRRRLAAFFAGSDLFCLPSRHETFGFAFLEAMAAGLPVVALDAGAAPEVIGEAGRLVPPDDARALAGAIQEITGSPTLAGNLAEAGRRRAARFSWGATARRYLEVAREARSRQA